MSTSDSSPRIRTFIAGADWPSVWPSDLASTEKVSPRNSGSWIVLSKSIKGGKL